MGRYKIVNMKKAPSKEEIESLKSFDSIVKSYHSQKWISRLKLIFLLSTTVLVISAGLWAYFELNLEPKATIIESKVSQLRTVPIVPDTSIIDTVIVKKQTGPLEQGSKELKSQENINPTINDTIEQKKALQEYSFKEAFAPYDSDSLLGQFANQLNQIIKTEYQGSTVIAFKVTMDGSIIAVKTINSTTSEIDSLLTEFWSNAPDWHPAELNGAAVSSTITLPIEINIQPIN
jgi:hypothetical protein